MKPKNTLAAALALGIFAGVSAQTIAVADGGPQVDVQPLFANVPADLGGKQMTVVEVTIPPGAGAPPHWHPGSVFAYVISGTIRSQINDEVAIDYEAGQFWYEPVDAKHAVFVNPSDSVPAKIVAVMFGDEGDELVIVK